MPTKTNSAFMKPMVLSDELTAVVGKGPLPRSEIITKLWIYIKANKLQDPKDGRVIIADDKLKKFLKGESKVNMMKLGGFISKNVS